MESAELLMVCIAAFVMVFVLLTLLAVVMRLITGIFPEKARTTDSAVLAAVASVVSSVYPGTNITKIEEIK